MQTRVFVNRSALLLVLPLLALFSGCGSGGGDGGTAAAAAAVAPIQTLSGTAATGLPIVSGNIMIKCAGGSNLSAQTGVDGAWTVTLSGQTLPCAAQVSGGTVNGVANSASYHAIAIDLGTVNITPLTDLIVANVAGQTPASWFNGLSGTALTQKATAAAMTTALTNVRSALGSVGGMSALASANPMTTSFSAVAGNTMDDMLEALHSAIAKAGNSYSAILMSASAGGGFSVSLSPSGSGSVPGSGGTGTGTLTLGVNAGGVSTTVILQGVTKPASQTAFCSDITSSSSSTSLSNALGAAGTFTVNSCSFNGATGNVSATLSITSPVALTVPYTVTYTYGG